MFGHHDDNQPQPADDDAPVEAASEAKPANENQENTQPAASPPADDASTADQTVVKPDSAGSESEPAATAPPQDNQHDNQDAADATWQHSGAPSDKGQDQINDIISPAGGYPKRPSYQYPLGSPGPKDAPSHEDDPANQELVDVKEHALTELAPLLDKLDLPPEEKFRAVMMVVQANDDKALVKAAYEAAHAIEDDEARARALFTIVNEVDYFTQPDNA